MLPLPRSKKELGEYVTIINLSYSMLSIIESIAALVIFPINLPAASPIGLFDPVFSPSVAVIVATAMALSLSCWFCPASHAHANTSLSRCTALL